MSNQQIKILLFDLGGVIINLYPERTFKAFAELAGIDEWDVMEAYKEAEFFKLHEQGIMNNEHFRDKLRKALNVITDDESIDKAWNAMLGDIPEDRIEDIKQLKKKFRCVVLSNTNSIHENCFHKILSESHSFTHLNELFNEVFFSHELSDRKPEPSIYQKVQEACGVELNEILFLDDSKENIAAAKSVGMHVLHIPRNEGFSDLLNRKLEEINS
ncbi:HAD family phosphatase [Marivirga atlantica]|uniref:HAD family phosphatase n=1 Tax=Marivirga atlantica TaxID=1548457 RepID=A0A937AA67_9BACT|nr:HAD family phosphatase [Marivirga atlantica]MBL0766672.1 HAD family phosphatase [Marivirga atlantica]